MTKPKPKPKPKRLSPAQIWMLKRAAHADGMVATVQWREARTAVSLAKRGLGVYCREVYQSGWGMLGWCFVINERGKRAVAVEQALKPKKGE